MHPGLQPVSLVAVSFDNRESDEPHGGRRPLSGQGLCRLSRHRSVLDIQQQPHQHFGSFRNISEGSKVTPSASTLRPRRRRRLSQGRLQPTHHLWHDQTVSCPAKKIEAWARPDYTRDEERLRHPAPTALTVNPVGRRSDRSGPHGRRQPPPRHRAPGSQHLSHRTRMSRRQPAAGIQAYRRLPAPSGAWRPAAAGAVGCRGRGDGPAGRRAVNAGRSGTRRCRRGGPVHEPSARPAGPHGR